MSTCLPTTAMQEVTFREHYPDGLRDTLACGHVVYTSSLDEVDQRLCLCCLRTRKPRRRGRRQEGRPQGEERTWQKSRR